MWIVDKFKKDLLIQKDKSVIQFSLFILIHMEIWLYQFAKSSHILYKIVR